ncbi:MAG: ribosome maturation factor RimP [Cellvibrionales bacterium]|nr:ribosome maturation factor RimP [Cellvibrionales bacterium]
MPAMDQETALAALLAPTVAGLGCELWGIEYRNAGPRRLLRVFIDRPQGVRIEDCERVSRQLSALLDVEDPLGGAYTLEVSSPGLDRRLYEIAHYRGAIGSLVQVRLRPDCGERTGRRNFKGRLVAVEDAQIVLRQDEAEWVLPLETLERARVVPEFT